MGSAWAAALARAIRQETSDKSHRSRDDSCFLVGRYALAIIRIHARMHTHTHALIFIHSIIQLIILTHRRIGASAHSHAIEHSSHTLYLSSHTHSTTFLGLISPAEPDSGVESIASRTVRSIPPRHIYHATFATRSISRGGGCNSSTVTFCRSTISIHH